MVTNEEAQIGIAARRIMHLIGDKEKARSWLYLLAINCMLPYAYSCSCCTNEE